MLQIATVGCQVRRTDGKIVTLAKGEVIDYEGGHTHLRPIEGKQAEHINFSTAGEDELFETEFDLDKLKQFIIHKYEVPVRVKSKKKLIEKLLDCRFRTVSDADLNRLD